LLKYDSSAGFAFDSNPFVINSIKNENPEFVNPYIEKMNMRVKPNSIARNKGNQAAASSVPFDIVNVSRTTNPTLGAYQ
jgi:hypothetical protein